MSEYSMEDLIPIITELSFKYTSGESTSITYDTAAQLMKAILYSIQEYESSIVESSEDVNSSFDEVDLTEVEKDKEKGARLAYSRGYELVVLKAKKAIHLYDEIIADFKSYRNISYYDTIVKGMPSFFLYYDAKFNPQNHILTLDYQTMKPLEDLCGIDAIYQYLIYIQLEQKFLSNFPEDYVIQVLSNYHDNYGELFINICSIVLRNVIGNMIVEKKIVVKGFKEENFINVKLFVSGITREELEEKLVMLIRQLIDERYNGDKRLFEYLKEDVKDFSVELRNAVKNNCLQRLFLL